MGAPAGWCELAAALAIVVVPALVLLLGFDMPTAAGTSLVVIAIDSAAALAARAGPGGLALDWTLVGAFAAAAVAGALAGAGWPAGPARSGSARRSPFSSSSSPAAPWRAA